MNIALILSGGNGCRMGANMPKQYIEIKGKPIIAYCLKTIALHEKIDGIQIVAEEQWQQYILQHVERTYLAQKFKGFSSPGKNRQLSIWNGLKDIRLYAADQDLVLIHDAARPLLSFDLLGRCLQADGYDGILPVLPMKDTVYTSRDGKKVTSLLDRAQVFAGQAPESFVLGAYYRANQVLLPEKILEINGSTEPAIMAGMNIKMIPGDERNFKITTKEDLQRFGEIAAQRDIAAW